MRDIDVRTALKKRLAAEHAGEVEAPRIINELGLEHGDVRVDVAVINGELQGYELKSARDTLERLPRQVLAYSAALDRATLVVSENHLDKAAALVPRWWGLVVAVSDDEGGVLLETSRYPEPNPSVSPLAVAQLLWRPEALAMLEAAGAANGLRSKPRPALYARLTECLPPDQLRAQVRQVLKRRERWRADEPRT